MRNILVWLHRYVGLLIAMFLLVAASTGVILTFYHELDGMVIDAYVDVDNKQFKTHIDPLQLRNQLASQYPGYGINYVRLKPSYDTYEIYYLSAINKASSDFRDELIVDRHSGAVLLERKWGDISEGWINLLPFIYRLHYSLALDDLGTWLFGIAALLWTLDCFVGAYLTMPTQRRTHRQSWFSRWQHAWIIRRLSSTYKLNFDLHRASGLWLWAMLFVLAWSSVGLNLKSVYQPTMDLAFDRQINPLVSLKTDGRPAPTTDAWQAALQTGRQRMQETAETNGFEILNEQAIVYHPKQDAFEYRVQSDRDIWDPTGLTRVYFRADDGKLLGSYIPTGKASGDTITNWLLALHLAQIWGVPYKIFLIFVGLAIVMLTVTGIYIWWKKRVAKIKYVAHLRG